MFDYESKSLESDSIQVSGSTLVVRDANSLKTTLPKLDTPESYQKLLSVVYKNGKYWVYNVQSLYTPEGDNSESFTHFKQVW